jgi:hypothetical protein
MVASVIKRGNSDQQVFTKIYFATVFVGIIPIGGCLGLGAFMLSPAVPWSWVWHLVLGGGLIAGAVSLAALLAVPAILANRDHITVTGDAITFEAWSDGSRVTLSRQEGDLLLVLPGFAYPGRCVSRRITQLGTGRAINVSWFFHKRAIRRACERSGWRFGYSPDLAERHLRRWRAWDWRASAYDFIRLHGPFAMPDVPGGRLSLGAAILEGYGDEIIEAAHARFQSHMPDTQFLRHAVRVYRRAADEQRVYAALAGSAGERATRMAEADRLAAKATEVGPVSAW